MRNGTKNHCTSERALRYRFRCLDSSTMWSICPPLLRGINKPSGPLEFSTFLLYSLSILSRPSIASFKRKKQRLSWTLWWRSRKIIGLISKRRRNCGSLNFKLSSRNRQSHFSCLDRLRTTIIAMIQPSCCSCWRSIR